MHKHGSTLLSITHQAEVRCVCALCDIGSMTACPKLDHRAKGAGAKAPQGAVLVHAHLQQHACTTSGGAMTSGSNTLHRGHIPSALMRGHARNNLVECLEGKQQLSARSSRPPGC